jgi:hypothetical protein
VKAAARAATFEPFPTVNILSPGAAAAVLRQILNPDCLPRNVTANDTRCRCSRATRFHRAPPIISALGIFFLACACGGRCAANASLDLESPIITIVFLLSPFSTILSEMCGIKERNYRRRHTSQACVIREADAHEPMFASGTETTAGKTVDTRKLARRDSSR